jgi:hypothetical protein
LTRALATTAAVGFALVVTASGASRPAAPSAAPNAVPDQGNPFRPSACGFTGWRPDDGSSWAAQTFTAGSTGRLTDVVLRLHLVNPQFAVVLTTLDAAGQPMLASPLTSTIATRQPVGSYQDIAVSFGSPATVRAGQHYAVVLLVPTATAERYVAWAADLGASVRDSRGAACADGAYGAGRALGKGLDPPGPTSDFFFQTFVVPAKATLVVRKVGSGSVTSRPAGIACGTRCRFAFAPGVVTLNARPAPGWRFARWQGACRGTKAACSLRLAGPAAATAVFVR